MDRCSCKSMWDWSGREEWNLRPIVQDRGAKLTACNPDPMA